MRPTLLCLAAALSVAAFAPAQDICLSTLFARNNGGSNGGAVYFDVNVLNPNGITVTSLETNTADLVGFSMDVYTAPLTSVGNETNAAAWTLVATGSGTGLGNNVPTPIDISNFNLAPGTYGVALVMSSAAGHDYTNGNGTNQFYANADLEISLGKASNVPFTAPTFSPRIWNGSICYHEQSECYLMAGLIPSNFRMGQDTLLVEPLLMVPMTLSRLPVIDLPANSGLVGVSLYLQSLMYNPAMFPSDPLRLSPGLQYNIGVATTPYGTGSGLSMWPIGAVVAQPGGRIEIDFSID